MLNLVSIEFLILFTCSIIIYYSFMRKYQWQFLLLLSVGFFALSSIWYTAIYLLLAVDITLISTVNISKNLTLVNSTDGGESNQQKAKSWLLFGIVGNLAILATLKYIGFIIGNIDSVARVINGIPMLIEIPEWAAPIGISFYTLSAIGYIVDCYNGICKPSGNLFKDALFICYWPILTSGPILRYNDVKDELFSEHKFDIDRICFGIQRMLWGFIKKIVISARLATVVDTIYADTAKYNGTYIWIAAVFFVLQLYTDFSGCMDIILGASECYGIDLPENFRTPFFAKTIQEFWQRWHMTLGKWCKDYILYPILNTGWMSSIEQKTKKCFGRKIGRQFSSCFGMLFVWLIIGLWHGGHWKFVAMGLYFWVIIVFENLTSDWFDKLWKKMSVPTDTVGWKLLRCMKVFILVTIGDMFFRLQNIKITLHTMRQAIHYNPWIFFDDSLYNLGLSRKSFNLMLIGVAVLFIVSFLKRKYDLRQAIARQPLVVRWAVYLVLVFAPLILGIYGPGYNAADFIYGGF